MGWVTEVPKGGNWVSIWSSCVDWIVCDRRIGCDEEVGAGVGFFCEE